jgi:hypothetical protein
MPLSYQLHVDLAEEHSSAERWGFRKVHHGQLSAKVRQLQSHRGKAIGTHVNGELVSL